MNIKQQINQDLKAAMLQGNKILTTTLRGLKSVILYAEVAQGQRDKGITDAQVVELFAKEAKKRQESADLYAQAGDQARVDAELAEKSVIEKYLPKQLSDDELRGLIRSMIEEMNASGPQALGQVIVAVKQASAGRADGGRIAAAVREQLSK